MNDTTSKLPDGSPLLTDGKWHDLVLSRQNATLTLYVDGVSRASDADGLSTTYTDCTAGGYPNQAGEMIGKSTANTDRTFRGDMADVELFNYGMDAGQVAALGDGLVGGGLTKQETAGHCSTLADKHAGAGRHVAGDPVDTADGNFYETQTDLSIPGRGVGLSTARTYNSIFAATDGPFGYGWTSNWLEGLSVDSGTGDVTVSCAGGAQISFEPDGSGGYLPAAPRMTATLTHNGDGTWTMVADKQDTYSYNASWQLTSTTTVDDYTTTLGYTSGELSSVTDSAGDSLAVYWTGSHITSIVDPAGREVDYDYTGGDLTKVTDVDQGVWNFNYYSGHLLHTMEDPAQSAPGGNAKMVTNVYDSSGRVTEQTDQDNRSTWFDYTSIPSATKVTDPKGNVTVDYYSPAGLLSAQTRGYGTTWADTLNYQYDPVTAGVTEVTDQDHTVLSQTSYYDDGNVETATNRAGVETTYTYTGENLPATVTQAAQSSHPTTTAYKHDLSGHPDVVTSVDTPIIDTQTGASSGSRTVQYNHDDSSHPTDVTSMVDPDTNTWTYTYDPHTGLETSMTDPAPLNEETTWSYDLVGRIQSMTTPKGNTDPPPSSAYTYNYLTNGFGQVTQVTDPNGNITKTSYDPDGNTTSTTDANNNQTIYKYDDADQQNETDRPGASTSHTDYWPDGSLETQTDGAGNATTYNYDPLGRLQTVVDPLGHTETYGYNIDGDMTSDQSPGGNCLATPTIHCTTYSYDPTTGYLSGISYSTNAGTATPAVSDLGYDAYGNRITMRDGTGESKWSWDSLGNLTSATDGNANTVGYTYDDLSLLRKIAYPGGNCTTGTRCVTRGYDQAGRWTSVTDWNAHTTNFGYDANSNEHTITYPTSTGNIDTFNFDNADQLKSIAYAQGATTTASFTYGRLDDGSLSSQSQTGMAGDATDTYGYSSIDQLCWSNPSSVTSNASDTSACSSSPSGSSNYGYDTADNLTRLATGPRSGYDVANQLCWQSPSGASGTDNASSCATATHPTDATTYGYDDSGNRTSATPVSGPGSAYGYDQADRMVSATVPDLTQANSGQYTSVTPSTIYTATAVSGTATVTVAGQGGIPTSGVAAVALTVYTSGSTAAGTATVYRSDGSAGSTPNVAYQSGQGASNLVITKLGTDGKINVDVSGGNPNLSVLVEGWYAAPTGDTGGEFTPVNPTTILATGSSGQTGECPTSPTQCTDIPALGTLTVQVTGQGGVPTSGISAVALNMDAINTTASGALVAYPTGTSAPPDPMVVHNDIQAGAGLDIVPVSSTGQITILNYSGSTATVLASVEGWISNGSTTADVYAPSDPVRVLDTTTGTGTCDPSPCTTLAANTSMTVTVAGQATIPSTGVKAVMANITVDDPPASGLLQASSTTGGGTGLNLVFNTGDTQSLEAIIPVGTDGNIELTDAWSAVNLTIDIEGWYTAADQTWNYTYNGDGTRTQKTGPDGTTTHYTTDTADPLPETLQETTSSATTNYIWGPDGLPIEQINPDNSIYYLHHDQLGSTRALTDSTGATIATYTYNPYGQLAPGSSAVATPYQYAGNYTDPETGYQYDHTRFYDPTTAQFLTRDPLDAITRSPYGYVDNNPLNDLDPLGLCGMVCRIVNTTVSVATSGTANCVIHVTCPKDATNSVGFCTIHVSCPAGTQSLADAYPAARDIGIGAVFIAGGALVVASGGVLVELLPFTGPQWQALGLTGLIALPNAVEGFAVGYSWLFGCSSTLTNIIGASAGVPRPQRPAPPGDSGPVDPNPPPGIYGN